MTAHLARSIALDSVALWVGTHDGILLRFAQSDAWGLRAFANTPIRTVAVSADESQVIASDESGAVIVVRAFDGALVDAFTCAQRLRQAAIVGPRAYVTVDARRNGLLWEVGTDDSLVAATVCRDGATRVAFERFGVAPDGARLTLLSALNWSIWDRATNRVVATHQPIDGMRLAYLDGYVGLNAPGTHYYLHWDDLCVIDCVTETVTAEGDIVDGARSAALSDDGTRLAVGCEDGSLVVVDGPVRSLALRPTDAPITALAWQPLGRWIAWLDAAGAFGVVDAVSGAELIDRSSALSLLA